MTHSGGKPHAVGDRGQRYMVTYFDPRESKRKTFGWSDDAEGARAMGDSIDAHPAWQFPHVIDRTFCPGCGKPYPSECDWCAEDVPRPASREGERSNG
jgi:hypothetical protein